MSRLYSMNSLLLALCCYHQLKLMTATTISTTASNEYQHKTIECASNEPCTVNCQHMFACNNATINCPIDQTCDVTCNHTFTCGNAIINAKDSSFFRLLNCEYGVYTCVGINIYFPPSKNGIPTSAIIGPDTAGLSAGGGAGPLNFYAINGWNDVDITTSASFSFDLHDGVMHCDPDYTASCDFAASAWSCANADDYCNDPVGSAPPTKSPTKRPTIKPTTAPIIPGSPTKPPTTRPTPSPTSLPTSTPVASASNAECIAISKLGQTNLDGNWVENTVSEGRSVYTLNSDYWLYYVTHNTHGYWMIGIAVGSVDWNDIYAYCFDEEIMTCSGNFWERSDTGGAFVENKDSIVVDNCTDEPDDNTNDNGNGDDDDTQDNGNDDDGGVNDEQESGGFNFDFPPKIVISGYIIPWYLFLVLLVFLCMCCCICGMICLKKRKADKQAKTQQDNQYGDRVQMIQTGQRGQRGGRGGRGGPYNQKSW